MTISSPCWRSTLTVRISTVRSGLTTKTYWPACEACTAAAGTTTAFGSVLSTSVTCTNNPGQSAWSVLGNVPFSLIVPVVGSTELSMKLTTPPPDQDALAPG